MNEERQFKSDQCAKAAEGRSLIEEIEPEECEKEDIIEVGSGCSLSPSLKSEDSVDKTDQEDKTAGSKECGPNVSYAFDGIAETGATILEDLEHEMANYSSAPIYQMPSLSNLDPKGNYSIVGRGIAITGGTMKSVRLRQVNKGNSSLEQRVPQKYSEPSQPTSTFSPFTINNNPIVNQDIPTENRVDLQKEIVQVDVTDSAEKAKKEPVEQPRDSPGSSIETNDNEFLIRVRCAELGVMGKIISFCRWLFSYFFSKNTKQ